MHDLLETLEDALYTLDEKGQRQYKASVSEQRRNTLETLETYLKPLCRDGAFAPIFDRKSTIDISKEDLVIFDMSLLNDMQENIYNALYYQVMVIMWAEVYKNRVINDGLPKDDLRHCICVFDESHKVLNTKNIWGLDFIEKMTRRDRKYLAALWFASQQPRDYAPSGATEHLDKIKNIFGLVQYKVLMQQDESDYDVLQNLFPQFTRSEIESTAYFQKGEQLLSLGAGAKIHCTTQVPEEYLEYFEGGL